MKIDKEVLIHVGLPKAASTSLQRNVLCRSQLGFVPMHGSNIDAASVDAVDHFISESDLAFDAVQCQHFFNDELIRHVPSGKVAVLSQEQLIGNPDKGLYYTKDVGSRLKSVFPDARVLIVVHEQCSYALSCYNQRIRSGSNMSLERFIGKKGTCRTGYPPVLNSRFLEFDRIVTYYQSLFGVKGVLVLPFEKVIRDLPFCLRELQKFVGVADVPMIEVPKRENRGEGMLTVRLRRFCNTFSGEATAFGPEQHAFSWKVVLGGMKLAEYVIPKPFHLKQRERYMDIIRAEYGGRFVDSNRRLSEVSNLDLSTLGYM